MFLTSLHAANEWFSAIESSNNGRTAVTHLLPGEQSVNRAAAYPESDQVLLVLEGEVLAEIADETARLRQGDVVIVPAGIDHRFVNNTLEPARTLSVYAPAD